MDRSMQGDAKGEQGDRSLERAGLHVQACAVEDVIA
jgi:hypothetical protein